jgi:hypothetical protein
MEDLLSGLHAVLPSRLWYDRPGEGIQALLLAAEPDFVRFQEYEHRSGVVALVDNAVH